MSGSDQPSAIVLLLGLGSLFLWASVVVAGAIWLVGELLGFDTRAITRVLIIGGPASVPAYVALAVAMTIGLVYAGRSRRTHDRD